MLERNGGSPVTADVAARRAVRVQKVREVGRRIRLRDGHRWASLQRAAVDAAPAIIDLARDVVIGEAMGRGQYSVVRAGRLRSRGKGAVGRRVAVKTVALEYAPLVGAEIDAMNRFHHPNLCALVAVALAEAESSSDAVDASKEKEKEGDGDDAAATATLHLVLEHCGDRTLTDVVDTNGPLSDEAAAASALCLLTALACLHRGGVCHRDVKPDNCVFRGTVPSNELCLVDFGLCATAADGPSTSVHDAGAPSTVPSSERSDRSAVGTVDFIAPECVLGDACATTGMDVWGVGVVLYFALSGRLPFGSRSAPMGTIMRRIVGGRYAPIESASRGAVDLIAQMMEVEPEHRITCAEALAHPWIRGAALRAQTAAVAASSSSSSSSSSSGSTAVTTTPTLSRTITRRLSRYYRCGTLARRAIDALSGLAEYAEPESVMAAELEQIDASARAAFRAANVSCSGSITLAEIGSVLSADSAGEVEVPAHVWHASCGGGAIAASGATGDSPSLIFRRFRTIWFCGTALYRTETAAATAHALLHLEGVMDVEELRAVLLAVGGGVDDEGGMPTPAPVEGGHTPKPPPMAAVPASQRSVVVSASASASAAATVPSRSSPAPSSLLPSSIGDAVAGLDDLFSGSSFGRLSREPFAPAVDAEAEAAGGTFAFTPPTPTRVAAADFSPDAPELMFTPYCSPNATSARKVPNASNVTSDVYYTALGGEEGPSSSVSEGGGGGAGVDDASPSFAPFGIASRVRVRFVGMHGNVVNSQGTVRFEGSIVGRENPINVAGDRSVVGSFRHCGWVGVELDDAVGVNDGSVDGTRYFDVAAAGRNSGIFVPPDACTPLPPLSVVEQPKRPPPPRPAPTPVASSAEAAPPAPAAPAPAAAPPAVAAAPGQEEPDAAAIAESEAEAEADEQPVSAALTKGRVARASVWAGVSIAADGLRPLSSCYMMKKSKPHKITRITHWSKRWFVCGDTYLRYYRTEESCIAASSISSMFLNADDEQPEGALATVDLRRLASIEHPGEQDFELVGGRTGHTDAVAGSAVHNLSLRAPSVGLANEWVDELRARLQRFRDEGDDEEESSTASVVETSLPLPLPRNPSQDVGVPPPQPHAPATTFVGEEEEEEPPPSDEEPPPSDDEPPPPPPPPPPPGSRPPPAILRVLARAAK